MLNTPLPKGLNEALPDGEEDGEQQCYKEGMRLTADSPSWLWKSMRKHLASQPGTNKAGKKVGKGTISKARKERRKHLQPGWDGGDGADEGDADASYGANSWERERFGPNSWERGYSSQSWDRGYSQSWGNSWERDCDWEEDGWWGTGGSQWPEAPPLEKGRSRSSSRKRLRLRSQERAPSKSQSPSPRHKPQMWRKKEVDPAAEADRKKWLDDHALQPIPEKKEETPLEKGDGAEASAKETPLEKGALGNEMKEEETPLKKGAVENELKKETPLEKGGAGAVEKKPLKKGHIMVDFHNVLEVDEVIPEESHAAMLRLLDAGCQVTVCSWCYKRRATEVMETMQRQVWYPRLASCFIVTDRKGYGSKAWHCERLGIEALVDDSGDILEDARKNGVAIFPVVSSKNTHNWWLNQGGTIYTSLGPAVDAYLKSMARGGL